MSDLISRQAAIDALDKRFDGIPIELTTEILELRRDLRERIPSAEPQRKKGKWVDGWSSRFDGTRHWFRECSECGYERDDDNPEKDTNYCPNCGADMTGGDDV